MESPSISSSSSSPKRKQTRLLKKPRSIQACDYCRLKKYKCDGKPPCSLCRTKGRKQPCNFQSVNGATIVSIDEPRMSLHKYKLLEQKLALAEAALRMNGIVIDNPDARTWNKGLSFTSAQEHSDDKERTQLEKIDRQIEILELNKRTREFEYHGPTSYLTFLDQSRKLYQAPSRWSADLMPGITIKSGKTSTAVLDVLHNSSFFNCRAALSANKHKSIPDYSTFPARVFLDSYFVTAHLLHPIVFEEATREIARQLWQHGSTPYLAAFDVLYFAVLSLGALTHNWEEGLIGGMGRFEWSRLFFSQAEAAMASPGSQNNIAVVQAAYILAKVCQFELNLPLAYSYLGIATRTALSLGLNRSLNPHADTSPDIADRRQRIDSQTWWAVYSFEMELSFTLGRPSTLGDDIYHNQRILPVGDTVASVIPLMLPLSRTIRKVTPLIYLEQLNIGERLRRTAGIEQEMQEWLEKLPSRFQPLLEHCSKSESCLFGAPWIRMQKFALAFRYLHLRLVMYHPFLSHVSSLGPSLDAPAGLVEAAAKCTESAVQMVELMCWAFHAHKFVSWWWDNVIYVTFALSALLLQAAKPGASLGSRLTLLKHIEQCVLLFDAMNDCDVSRNLRDLAQENATQLKLQTLQRL